MDTKLLDMKNMKNMKNNKIIKDVKDVRCIKEANEEKFLSPYALKSSKSIGRTLYEPHCSIRTCFQRDRDRIIHSKYFRRLSHKTQVFIAPENDHFRTRMTHTLEVSQISRAIASALFLNEDLTEAIALGHDLGHTPFGHLGEDALNKILVGHGGFRHNEHSVRAVEKLEKNGKGLNLTQEVLDGILHHRTRCQPKTLEAKVVQIADKIAYINHDIEDAITAGILKQNQLPKDTLELLGDKPRDIISFLVNDIIKNSKDVNNIIMTQEVKTHMYKLRDFLFKNVYNAEKVLEERKKHEFMIEYIYNYYYENFDELPEEFLDIHALYKDIKEITICDYIASMTDRYAIKKYNSINKDK